MVRHNGEPTASAFSIIATILFREFNFKSAFREPSSPAGAGASRQNLRTRASRKRPFLPRVVTRNAAGRLAYLLAGFWGIGAGGRGAQISGPDVLSVPAAERIMSLVMV